MRAVVQRVSRAKVKVDNKIVGEIKNGLLVLLAVHVDDTEDKIFKLADKIIKLRIFEDQAGKMNRSITDVAGEFLVVSQFTLYGDAKKGNRPSYIKSARPDKAIPFYKKFIARLKENGFNVESGNFGEMMNVELTNNGPVTIIIDT